MKRKGRVVSVKANYLEVDISNELNINRPGNGFKNRRLLCTLRNRLKYTGIFAYAGDSVSVESIDWIESKGVISDIEPRESWLDRPPVANVTQIIVVISLLQPTFDLEQVSRFLITAEETGIDILLVLTKRDLITPNELHSYISRFKEWGYSPIAVSIINRDGLDELLQCLRSSKLSVLCGPSGVGKSSLINYFLPFDLIRTAPVSKKLGRGRQTTRNIELFSIGNNSLVADTPGFNKPDIKSSPLTLAQLFPEIRHQLKDQACKFRDCLHRDEPGCIISKSWERYYFYKELVEELISSGH